LTLNRRRSKEHDPPMCHSRKHRHDTISVVAGVIASGYAIVNEPNDFDRLGRAFLVSADQIKI